MIVIDTNVIQSCWVPGQETTRRRFEQQLAQKDNDIAKREHATREKKRRLTDAKTKIDEQVTVKKIPKQVLSPCEWGHDDDLLQVENPPKSPPEPGQREMGL
ncbi:MAG: hypothetical protein ABI630_01745 [Betaproteobacteria bacterium]